MQSEHPELCQQVCVELHVESIYIVRDHFVETLSAGWCWATTGRFAMDNGNLTSFPWDTELFIEVFRIEESMSDRCQVGFHVFVQNYIVPACFLDFLPELCTLSPPPVVHPYEVLKTGEPITKSANQIVSHSRWS